MPNNPVPPNDSQAPGPEIPQDSGLLGLVLIARFHQIPVTPEGLRHQFAPAVKEIGKPAVFSDQEILLAAKSLGFGGKCTHLDLKNIDNAILPALGKNRDGDYFILVQNISGEDGLAPSPKRSFGCGKSSDRLAWLYGSLAYGTCSDISIAAGHFEIFTDCRDLAQA